MTKRMLQKILDHIEGDDTIIIIAKDRDGEYMCPMDNVFFEGTFDGHDLYHFSENAEGTKAICFMPVI